MKKIKYYILTFILTFVLFNSNVLATQVVSNCSDIPSKASDLTRFAFTLIKYAVPILLVVVGSIDYLKAATSNDQDMLSKALKSFTKRLVAGALVFLIILLFQTVIRLVSNEQNIFSCITCFLTSEDSCSYKEAEEKQEGGKVTTGVKDNETDFDDPSDPTDPSDPNSPETPKNTNGNIFVGDSRFWGMQNHVGAQAGEKYVAKIGEGLSWLNSSAIGEVNNYISSNNGKYNIIINLGVNDMGNINSYITKYTSLANGDWKQQKIIVVSVNPIEDSKATQYTVRDKDVVVFNNKMKSITSKASNIKYCDTYSQIKSSFKTTDGVHYNAETSKKIHDYIINKCL